MWQNANTKPDLVNVGICVCGRAKHIVCRAAELLQEVRTEPVTLEQNILQSFFHRLSFIWPLSMSQAAVSMSLSAPRPLSMCLNSLLSQGCRFSPSSFLVRHGIVLHIVFMLNSQLRFWVYDHRSSHFRHTPEPNILPFFRFFPRTCAYHACNTLLWSTSLIVKVRCCFSPPLSLSLAPTSSKESAP